MIEGYEKIAALVRNLGAAFCLSGAGPTIIAFVDAGHADVFIQQMAAHLEEKGINGWQTEILKADPKGARIVIE